MWGTPASWAMLAEVPGVRVKIRELRDISHYPEMAEVKAGQGILRGVSGGPCSRPIQQDWQDQALVNGFLLMWCQIGGCPYPVWKALLADAGISRWSDPSFVRTVPRYFTVAKYSIALPASHTSDGPGTS